MTRPSEAATRAFEKVLDKARADNRQLDEWQCQCLRAALLMMAINDDDVAQMAIQGSVSAPPGVGTGHQHAFTIEDMRSCLAVLESNVWHWH